MGPLTGKAEILGGSGTARAGYIAMVMDLSHRVKQLGKYFATYEKCDSVLCRVGIRNRRFVFCYIVGRQEGSWQMHRSGTYWHISVIESAMID
jgi:hypothetical protein